MFPLFWVSTRTSLLDVAMATRMPDSEESQQLQSEGGKEGVGRGGGGGGGCVWGSV